MTRGVAAMISLGVAAMVAFIVAGLVSLWQGSLLLGVLPFFLTFILVTITVWLMLDDRVLGGLGMLALWLATCMCCSLISGALFPSQNTLLAQQLLDPDQVEAGYEAASDVPPLDQPQPTPIPEDLPSGDGAQLCPAMTTINSQVGLTLPTWNATYGDASRTGDEEPDTYPLYPHSSYLAIAAEFNGTTNATHMIYSQATREFQFTFDDAEVIPAIYGQDLGNIWADAQLLAAYKAAVKNVPSLPLYCWTVQPDGTLKPGINQ